MIQHYLKIAWRVITQRKKQYLLLSFGLSIGLTIALLVGFFINHELSYDTFHSGKDRIYRLLLTTKDGKIRVPIFPATFLPEAAASLAGIEQATRINTVPDPVISMDQALISTDHLIFTDPSFFQMFSFELTEGDMNALEKPLNIFVSQSFARVHFAGEDPVGKTLVYDNEHEFNIKGIFTDLPENSIFNGDLIASFSSRERINPYEFKHWYAKGTKIYVQLKDKVVPEEFENQVALIHEKIKPDYEAEADFILQPLTKVHLHSVDIRWDDVKKGDIKVVVGLGILSVFILLICIINYVLMHTALLTERASNMEMQKVMGASLWQLLGQILFETILAIVIACVLSYLFIQALIPWFNDFTDVQLQSTQFLIYPFPLYIGVGLIGIFLLIFIHPALFCIFRISLKSRAGQRSVHWKKVIVNSNIATQFAFTVMMLIGSIILYQQIKLITEKKLGFDEEQLVVIDNPWDKEMGDRFQRFRDEISSYPFVKGVAGTRNSPLENINNGGAFYSTQDQEKWINAGRVQVSPNFFHLLGTEFVEGEDFKPDFDLNTNSVIINKAAYEALAVQDIMRTEIVYPNIRDEAFTVVGVIKNIQHESAHEPNRPCVYFQGPKDLSGLPDIMVKLGGNDHQASLKGLEEVWKKLTPHWPFSSQFMDDRINQVYAYEIKSLSLSSKMAMIAVLISCLGILGFSMLTIEQRTKEIGIRKVVGARVKDIIILLNKSYVKWVFVGFVVAVPLTWYAMDRWLQNFAYKTNMSWWIFLAGGGMAILIALVAVSWYTWRASNRNPVEALRYE